MMGVAQAEYQLPRRLGQKDGKFESLSHYKVSLRPP